MIKNLVMTGCFFFLMAACSSDLRADSSPPGLFQQSSQDKALGQPLGGTFQAGVVNTGETSTPNASSVISSVEATVLGVALQALWALTTPANTVNGVTYTEFYSFGQRVFSENVSVTSSQPGQFNAGLPPAEIRVPVVMFPIGPIRLEVDGGARFQADIQGQTTPTIILPSTLSSMGVQLKTVADAAGFIEGYASLLIFRAGVGGQVNLVDAQASVDVTFPFDVNGQQGTPTVITDAMVDFLSGNFYAFLDSLSFPSFSFKRLLNENLYQWKGYCFSQGVIQCPAQ